MDMSSTIAPKSDQLNSDDLIGGPITITVTRVSGNEGSPEQPVNVYFEGDAGKPFRPCKSMRRVMVTAWGPDAAAYAGRSMTLYRDPTVAFGGMQVGGIRISHMSHIDRDMTMALTASKAQRKPYTVRVLKAAPKPAAAGGASAAEWCNSKATAFGGATSAADLEAWWTKMAATREKAAKEAPPQYEAMEAAYKAAIKRLGGGGFGDDAPFDAPPSDAIPPEIDSALESILGQIETAKPGEVDDVLEMWSGVVASIATHPAAKARLDAAVAAARGEG